MIKTIYMHWLELQKFAPVLRQLVRQQLILRYRRTALGYLWTLINPLLMMSVTAIVFATLFKVELKKFHGIMPANKNIANVFSSTLKRVAKTIAVTDIISKGLTKVHK